MSVKILKKGLAMEATHIKNGPEEETHKELGPVQVFDTPPCTVTYSAKMTINLGNFESAQVMVGLSMPCVVGAEDKTYVHTKRWVDERMGEVSAELETEVQS